MAPRVDDVEVEHHLNVAGALQGGNGLAHREVFAQRKDLRVHDAAGRLLAVFEQALDLARFTAPHQFQNFGGQLFRQVIDQRRRVIRRNFLQQPGDLLGRAAGQQLGALFGPHLADRFHGQTAATLNEQRKHGLALGVVQRAEDRGEVGRVLLLKQVQQVSRRANAEQPLDGVENDVDSAGHGHAIERC